MKVVPSLGAPALVGKGGDYWLGFGSIPPLDRGAALNAGAELVPTGRMAITWNQGK